MDKTNQVLKYVISYSISYQLMGQKQPNCLVKVSYRIHVGLNITCRISRIVLWHIIPTKWVDDAVITISNILQEINYQISI